MSQLKNAINEWKAKGDRYRATEEETCELLAVAATSKGEHDSIWPQLRDILIAHAPYSQGKEGEKEALADVRRARIEADLGAYPYTAEEFVQAYFTSRGVTLEFTGGFQKRGNPTNLDKLIREMVLCSARISMSIRPLFTTNLIEAALYVWVDDEHQRILRRAYSEVAFDKTADPAPLKAFAAYITAPVEDDPQATAIAVRATETALRNFIFRVKNHMRGVWKHSCHLMPVLTGEQGDNKTHAVLGLLKPIEQLYSSVGFELFGDNSREFDLSRMPVMFFDEMSGIGKADVEKLKGIMTIPTRAFRQIYQRPTTLSVVTTFIGCSNKDISLIIRDETGNRRFIQINTPIMDRDTVKSFDFLSMWRSVDEDAEEPPMYDLPEDLAAIKAIQSEQRHHSLVEEWILNCEELPSQPTRVTTLFNEHFYPWAELMFPHEAKWCDFVKFRAEMKRLTNRQYADRIIRTKPQNVVHYRFQKNGFQIIEVG